MASSFQESKNSLKNGVHKDRVSLEEFTFVDKKAMENSLTCQVCSRHLNVIPVVFSDTLGSVCGRCSGALSTKGLSIIQRQRTFENFINNFTFPCINKCYGCSEVLQLFDVESHEKYCRFQRINCPLSYKSLFPGKSCSWSGNNEGLSEHLRVHKEEFLDPPQFEWPKPGQNLIFFTSVGTQIITVIIKHEIDNRFACLLLLNGSETETQCFRYQLELTDEDKNNSILLRRNCLEPLSEFSEFLSRPEKTMEVDIDKISEMLHFPSKIVLLMEHSLSAPATLNLRSYDFSFAYAPYLKIPPGYQVFAKFGIVKKHRKEIAQITGVKDGDFLSGDFTVVDKEKNAPPDEDMLIELECPVCNEYMIPPIYICPTGHSVCNECKSQVQACPSCRSNIGSGRNFTLEKLTLKVRYPCRNRDIGCGFVTTSDKIKSHQSVCNLTENACILKCGWKGLAPGLYNHFEEQHKELLLPVNTPVQKDLKQDKNVGYYFFFVMGELFCLSYKNCGKFTVKFNMQQVGYYENEPKFRYCIQFLMHREQDWPSVYVSNVCQKWNDNLSESLTATCMTVPGELFKTCIYRNHSYYIKVKIVKL